MSVKKICTNFDVSPYLLLVSINWQILKPITTQNIRLVSRSPIQFQSSFCFALLCSYRGNWIISSVIFPLWQNIFKFILTNKSRQRTNKKMKLAIQTIRVWKFQICTMSFGMPMSFSKEVCITSVTRYCNNNIVFMPIMSIKYDIASSEP